jgi:hypothetical protein
MSEDSPAVILYDGYGQAIAVENNTAFPSSQGIIPVGGITTDGYASTILLNSDGTLAITPKTERFEKITVGTTDTIYMAEAALGSAEGSLVWTIRKIIITDNFPVSIMVSNDNVSWDDRYIITYS